MNRIATTDYDGKVNGWFDENIAKVWKTEHNTGGTWLYRSKGGKYIKNHWSRYEGSTQSYNLVSNLDAAKWLLKNNKELPEELEKVVEELEL